MDGGVEWRSRRRNGLRRRKRVRTGNGERDEWEVSMEERKGGTRRKKRGKYKILKKMKISGSPV